MIRLVPVPIPVVIVGVVVILLVGLEPDPHAETDAHGCTQAQMESGLEDGAVVPVGGSHPHPEAVEKAHVERRGNRNLG
jgi:hypothetical protein